MKRKEIVLVKETRQHEFVKKIMDAISPHLSLKTSDKVAIKINLSGSREIYANTHYETVDSLISYLKSNFGITDISIIEGSDGAFYTGKTTWDIFYKFRYKEVELKGAKLANLDELPHDLFLDVQTLSGVRRISYTKYDADYIISVVPPKTHHLQPVCLSIPNLTGFVKAEDRILMYGLTNSDLKKVNSFKSERLLAMMDLAGKNFAALLRAISPSMAIIDGLYGMEGKGPVKGSPVFHGFAIASEDMVMVDALTTYIMGFDVEHVAYLTHAALEELGSTRWQNVIGVDPAQVKFPYRPHPFFQKQRLWKSSGFKNNNNTEHTGNNGNGNGTEKNEGNNNSRDHRENGNKPFIRERFIREKNKNESNNR